MREFVVIGHDAPLEPDFPLDDLAGAAGRLDVLCRCVNATFALSHAIREDSRLHLVLRDAMTISFDGATLRSVAPDERNIAAHIRNALEAATDAVGHQAVESGPGIAVSKRGLESMLDGAADAGSVVQLHEAGRPLTELGLPENLTLVLSDHRDFTDEDLTHIKAVTDERVRVGPNRLHADHAIIIAHNYLDTAGYAVY